LGNKKIGKGSYKGGKKAVEKPFRGYNPATTSQREMNREAFEAQQAEARRAAAAQQVIDDAEMAAWGMPILNLAPAQPRVIRPRNIGPPRGGVREGANAPVNIPSPFPITFEMERQRKLDAIYTTIQNRIERVINAYNNGMGYNEAIGKLDDLYQAAKNNNFQELISEIENIENELEEFQLLRQQEEADRIQDEENIQTEDRLVRTMNRTENYPSRPYKPPNQPSPKRGMGMEGGGGGVPLTPTQRLHLIINRHAYISQMTNQFDRYQALFQLLEEFANVFLNLDEQNMLNAQEEQLFEELLEQYEQEYEDMGDALYPQGILSIQNPDDMEGGGTGRSRQVAPAPIETAPLGSLMGGMEAADAQSFNLADEDSHETFRDFIKNRVETIIGSPASTDLKVRNLRYLLTELAANGPDEMAFLEATFPPEFGLIRKSIETLRKDQLILKPAPAARLTPEKVTEKYEIISKIPSDNPIKRALLNKLIKETDDFVGRLSAANQTQYTLILSTMMMALDSLKNKKGGARYKYNPESGQYTRRSRFSRKTADTDIDVTQYKIDDLYTQLQLNHPSRRNEIIFHFINDNGYTDDQMDYILSVIDSNKFRRNNYSATSSTSGIETNQDVSIDTDTSQNIGSRSRFTGDDFSDLPEAIQVEGTEFIPRRGNRGTNPFQNLDDEGERIPQTGAGRNDCYNECSDCGCDSYRDFNALHAM
jgi:hypothetical protein